MAIPIEAVIFDMDGVIIDSELSNIKNLHQYVLTYNSAVTLEEMFDTVGRSAADCWERIRALMRDFRPWEEIRQEYRDTVKNELRLDYRQIFRPQMNLVLPALKIMGFKLAVASSSDLKTVRTVLSETGIAAWFDTVVSGESFSESKPNPAIYHHTAALLHVKEHNCLVLEDSTAGILAAKAAGMPTVALADNRFPFEQWRADFQINEILELLKIAKHY